MSSWKVTAISLLVGFFASVWVEPFIPTPAEGGPIAFATNPSVQLVLAFIFLSIVIHTSLSFATNRLFGGPDRRTANVAVSSDPPKNTVYTALIGYHNALWRAEHGYTRKSEVTHVEGPRCPHCEVSLDTKTDRHYVLWETQSWYCPSCGFETSSESPSDSPPRRAVENIVEVEAQLALQEHAGEEIEGDVSEGDLNYTVVDDELDEREARRINS